MRERPQDDLGRRRQAKRAQDRVKVAVKKRKEKGTLLLKHVEKKKPTYNRVITPVWAVSTISNASSTVTLPTVPPRLTLTLLSTEEAWMSRGDTPEM